MRLYIKMDVLQSEPIRCILDIWQTFPFNVTLVKRECLIFCTFRLWTEESVK